MGNTSRLVMRREGFHSLPPLGIDFGYLVRTSRPGDGPFWCSIVDGRVGDSWTPERFEREVLNAPRFDRRGLFFVTIGSTPAGTACAFESGDHDTGRIEMLAVRDEHRGRGIGHFLTLKALEYLARSGHSACEVETDDWRLPAIKTWLDMGFRPVDRHRSHLARWADVYGRIAREGRAVWRQSQPP